MSEHWYTRDGKPSHTRISKSGVVRSTTLRDARLERLLPSVSSVLNEAAAPELDRWKANKILEACYSSGDPLALAPTLSEYSTLIREKADKEMEQAQVFGTAFHKAMEGATDIPLGMDVLVDAANKELEKLKKEGVKLDQQEVSVANVHYGYAGTTDYAITDGLFPGIIDFKTCKSEKDEPIDFKRSHCAQIAAYAMAKYRPWGKELPLCTGINIYVSKTEPGRVDVVRYTTEQLEESWEWFKACLTLWRLRRGYDPREDS